MASEYIDLTDFLDDDGLPVTVKGKKYVIPAPNLDTGLRLQAIAQLGAKVHTGGKVDPQDLERLKLDDDQEREFVTLMLTEPITRKMDKDGLSFVQISRVAQYAFAHFAISPQSAARALEMGAFAGKAEEPQNRAARRAPAAKSARPASAGSRQTPRPTRSSSGTRSGARGR